jgi:hypothetical protein
MRLLTGRLLACLLSAALAGPVMAQDARSRAPVGLAPDPASTPEAVIQVYAARAIGLKGLFGVHTWIAVKPSDAQAYTVYEVIGWRQRRGESPVVIRQRSPDARWFGADPELIAEKRGPGLEAVIARIDKAAREYPWANEYTLWPGPNSNTFTAWIARAVPELQIDLPPTAIGKDYTGSLIGAAPSGKGIQLSLFGLLALTVSGVEGVEVNLLGLSFGLNPFDFSLKLPMLGRLGPARAFVPLSAQATDALPQPAPASSQASAIQR